MPLRTAGTSYELPSCSVYCHCCKRPARGLSAGATARPTSSKAGLGSEVTGFWTLQTHLPDQVRSGILQCLGCRAPCLKAKTLGRDLQNGGNLNPRSLGETVVGTRVLSTWSDSCREGPALGHEPKELQSQLDTDRSGCYGWGDTVARNTCRR